MFLNRSKNVTSGLRFKIAFTYFVLFTVSALVLFGFLYYLLSEALREKDSRIIRSDFKKFAVVVRSSGADGLKQWFERKQNLLDTGDVLIRLHDPAGALVFAHDPNIIRELEPATVEKALGAAIDDSLTRVQSEKDSEDAVEFFSDHLANGWRLQVGKDTEDREELMAKFREGFAIILLISVFTSLLTALLFSRAILGPVRRLIETIERVRKGDLTARAPVTPKGDEINELGRFLNGMLAQNSKLISALTESLDAVAHDLRTPLTRLRVFAERALESREPDAQRRAVLKEEALGEVLENTDQVIQLLDAILGVSESESGTLKLRLVPMNAGTMIREVLDVYSIVADDKSIFIKTSRVDAVDFRADVRVKQALANLIDNAIKFSPVGSSIFVSAVRTEHSVLISVEDEGRGLADVDLPRIWDRLYRSDSSRSERGMGLGLSLVRAIVTAHGGSVTAANRQPVGSRFEIQLPFSAPS